MKKIFLIFYIGFLSCFKSFSQVISLPKFYPYEDTVNNYYFTFCEEFNALFKNYHNRYNMKPDSCMIDFIKYDLKGTRENGEFKWELISPKKYCEETYRHLREYDSIRWNIFPRTIVIEDTGTFNQMKKKAKRKLKDRFDFSKTALIYNDVWIDCSGYFYYKILFDPIENVIVCNVIEIYGGSCGMCPKDSWITIDKPYPDTKIVLKGFWVN